MLRFYRHAAPSLTQAKRSDGNLHVAVGTINGVHHTLSAWTSRDALNAFLYSGAHAKAIRAFPAIATGKTFGYESDTIPDWETVHRIWLDHGRDYG